MNSFDVLSKGSHLERRLFLEASAGTGKTFTIEHLFVRLLLETDATVDQIVVVTFTRAATRELRERIRTNLEKIVLQASTFPYLESLSVAMRDKIKTAYLSFEQAQIFTIHGFCLRLLQEFGFEASVGLELQEWESDEERWEVLEFLRITRDVSPQQLRRLLASCRNDIDLFVQKLQTTQGRDAFSYDALLHRINRALEQVPFFPIGELFREIRPHYKGVTSPTFQLQADLLEKVLERGKIEAEELDQLIGEEEIFLEQITSANRKIRAKVDHPHQFDRLRETVWPLLEAARNPKQTLYALARAWQIAKAKLSEQSDKMSPDDLLKMVKERVNDAQFVERVRQKYRAVIVDEFQDTDPVQWEIFDTLFVQDVSKAVYLVGDPKQSIYAFRNADIYTFLAARDRFENHAMLTTNYRSGGQLIDRLNRLFCQAPWIDLPKIETTIDVPPVVAAKPYDGELYFVQLSGVKGRSRRWPTDEMEQRALFPFMVYEIQQRKFEFNHVAILVKDRYQALRVKNYLKTWGVPASYHRSASLGESLAIELLQETIEACVGHDRQTALRKIAIGPLGSLSIDHLTDEFVFDLKLKLAELYTVWQERGTSIFFAELMKSHIGRETVAANLINHDLYDDTISILEKVIFLQEPLQLIDALKQMKLQETDERVTPEPHGVQIMTIHASKGLEFEAVFALGLASRTTAEESEKLSEIEAEKMRQLYVALTRAKQALYVPVLKDESGQPVEEGEASPIELFLNRVNPELGQFQTIDISHREFVLEKYQPIDFEAAAPPPLLERHFKPIFLQSFTTLAKKGERKAVVPDSLPAGAETGIIFHAILERYFERKLPLQTVVEREIEGTHLAPFATTVVALIEKLLDLPLDGFTLRDVKTVLAEMEFMYRANGAYLKGFIDLCIEHEGRYYLVDWKTNLLEDYSPQTVELAMRDNDYFLQGEIYAEAMKRYLELHGNAPFHGIFFIFVRGPAAYWVRNNGE